MDIAILVMGHSFRLMAFFNGKCWDLVVGLECWGTACLDSISRYVREGELKESSRPCKP